MGVNDKESTCHFRRCKRHGFDLIPGAGRSPREGNGNSLQYCCLDKPMDRGSQVGYNLWGREESNRTKWLSVHAHTHTHTLPAVVNECLALQEHLKFLVTTKVCHNPQPSTSDNPSGSRVFSVAPVLTKKKPTALPDSHTWTCLPRLGKLPPLLFSCSLRMVAASSVPDNYLDFGIILFALWFSFT